MNSQTDQIITGMTKREIKAANKKILQEMIAEKVVKFLWTCKLKSRASFVMILQFINISNFVDCNNSWIGWE